MTKRCMKYEVPTFTHHKDMKRECQT